MSPRVGGEPRPARGGTHELAFRHRLAARGTAWPESAQQIAARPDRLASAERKVLGENALRLRSRLRE
jgi:hypothetical protein